jgi:signal transduction histidine kinase
MREEFKSKLIDLHATLIPYAAVLGAGAGVWAALRHKLLADERTVLLSMVGVDAVLLAIIVTAVALLVGLLEGLFGQMIASGLGGIRRFFFPFKVIAWVGALAIIVGLVAAIEVDISGERTRAALFGLSFGLTVATVLGSLALIYQIVTYSEEKRKHDTAKERAEAQKERKDRERKQRASEEIAEKKRELEDLERKQKGLDG